MSKQNASFHKFLLQEHIYNTHIKSLLMLTFLNFYSKKENVWSLLHDLPKWWMYNFILFSRFYEVSMPIHLTLSFHYVNSSSSKSVTVITILLWHINNLNLCTERHAPHTHTNNASNLHHLRKECFNNPRSNEIS